MTAAVLLQPATATPLLSAALELHAAGLCVLPAAEDGSKRPAVDWKAYQSTRPDEEQLRAWFSGTRTGLGFVCGQVSDGLEMLELEGRAALAGALDTIAELVEKAGLSDLWDRILRGYVVASPSGGFHFLYRIADAPVPPNTKLAATAANETLAETRGEGGWVVTAPSHGSVHPSGRPWVLGSGGPSSIPTITAEERADLHRLVRLLDERPISEPTAASPFQQPRMGSGDGILPGDAWAAVTSWGEILEPAGWRRVFSKGAVTYWRRPGKGSGISATTGYGGGDWFYPFTTSTEFEPEKTHTKFHVYAVLHHAGQHSDAAKALRARGFGKRVERPAPVGSRPEARTTTGVEAVKMPDFPWDTRPVLRHLHDFARARMVAPLALLGVALARVAVVTPAAYVLPPLVGGPGTPNLFVALVGPPGAGKGAGHAAAEDALDLSGWRDGITRDEQLYITNVGSGEGILHAYAMWSKAEGVQQIRESVLFVVNEVDQLTAVGSRQGATLMPKLREAYSGETLAFNYADPTKRLHVRRHHYRMALTVGVQPGRAAALFDDADGGTPQRFLWLPVTDPDMPRDRLPEPKRWTVKVPGRPPTGRVVVAVCDEAREEITEAHWRRSRGEGDALDGHALYTQLKVAAALAVLDGHLGTDGVTAEDWCLAGVLMDVSNATRTAVQAELRRAAAGANEARARAEAVRDLVKADTVEAAAAQKASKAALTALRKQPGEWLTGADLRRAVSSRVRPDLDAALDALVLAGVVEVDEIEHHGQPGRRYRSRS